MVLKGDQFDPIVIYVMGIFTASLMVPLLDGMVYDAPQSQVSLNRSDVTMQLHKAAATRRRIVGEQAISHALRTQNYGPSIILTVRH